MPINKPLRGPADCISEEDRELFEFQEFVGTSPYDPRKECSLPPPPRSKGRIMSAWSGSERSTTPMPLPTPSKDRLINETIMIPAFKDSHKKWASLVLGTIGGFGISQTLVFPLLVELPISFGVGSVLAVACYFIMDSFKTTKIIKIKDESSSKMLKEASNKVSTILGFSISVECQVFEQKIDQVTTVVTDLILELYDRPDQIFNSRDFLGYYLDAIITILENYSKITNVREKSKRAKEIDGLLDTVYSATKKKIESFDKRSTLELDTEITLLSNELKSKGF